MRRPPVPAPRRALPACIVAAAAIIIMAMNARPGGPPDGRDAVPAGPLNELGPRTLARAAATTRAVANARVELITTLGGPSGLVALAHRGAFVDGGERVSAESDLSQVAAVLGAAGERVDGDWSRPARVVVAGDTVYSQLGPMAAALGHSPDDWASAELASLVASGAVADNDTLALALDPLGPLDLLRRPVIQIGEVKDGPAPAGEWRAGELRGVAVHHLRASLDLTGGPEGEAPPEGSFEARLVAAGVQELPVDVWVGDDGVVRRLVVRVAAAGGMTTAFDVYDVGGVTDADVAAPDPAEVISPARGRGGPG